MGLHSFMGELDVTRLNQSIDKKKIICYTLVTK